MIRPLKNPVVRVLKRSCPAVSQICIFSLEPLISTILSLKSMAIVDRWFIENSFLLKRVIMQVLPIPLSPIINTFTKWSYESSFIPAFIY